MFIFLFVFYSVTGVARSLCFYRLSFAMHCVFCPRLVAGSVFSCKDAQHGLLLKASCSCVSLHLIIHIYNWLPEFSNFFSKGVEHIVKYRNV